MTRTWTTPDSSVSNASESIVSSRVGQKKDCPTKKSCGAASSASMRSIRFCSADESPANSSAANSTNRADLCRSISFLAEAWLHLLRRAHRPNRDHADRAGGKETMDQPVALSACAELLHVATRSGSATTRNLHRLAPAQYLGRHRCRRLFCYPFDFYPLGVEFHLRGFRQHPVDRSHLLRTETRRHRNRSDRRHSHRQESAQKRNNVGAGCARFYCHLLFQGSIPRNHPQRRRDWI